MRKDLHWYLTESIPNPLNSYQIAKIRDYVEDLKIHHKIPKSFGPHEPFTCFLCLQDEIHNKAIDKVVDLLTKTE